MKFKVVCPECQNVLNATDDLVGRKAKCPTCGGVILVKAPAVQGEEGLELLDEISETTLDEKVVIEAEVTLEEPVSRPSSGGTKTCPMCGETIKSMALVCRFCGEDLGASESRRGQGVWRDGNLLVMEKNADLPNRCVKTNEVTDRWLRRELYWHNPLLYFMIFFPGLLIYVIVALIVRKSATIKVGLSRQGFSSRRWGIAIGWLSFLVGGIVFFVGIANSQPRNSWWIACVAGPLGGLIGIIVGVMKSRVVAAAKITDDHVWLKGVHPDYLATLPAWAKG